jgi:hypothetical protein
MRSHAPTHGTYLLACLVLSADVNLMAAPYHLEPPLWRVDEEVKDGATRFLGLWQLPLRGKGVQ